MILAMLPSVNMVGNSDSESYFCGSRASVLSLHFGFKNYLMITSVIGAILTLGFPMMIRQSYILGLISRILLGSLHSGWFPGMV